MESQLRVKHDGKHKKELDMDSTLNKAKVEKFLNLSQSLGTYDTLHRILGSANTNGTNPGSGLLTF